MAVFKDLTGQKFERLKVLGVSRKVQSGKRERYYWDCICDCGKRKEVRTDCLTSGLVRSCGCLKLEQDRVNLEANHSHKLSGTRIYNEWRGIKARCLNPNNPKFESYGGRGITIFEAWKDDFIAFQTYMSQLPNYCKDGYTIDRIDNNRGYEPGNLRWADARTQCRNRRSTINVEYKGKKVTLIELSEITDISYATLNNRYKRGDIGERLVRPVEKKNKSIPR